MNHVPERREAEARPLKTLLDRARRFMTLANGAGLLMFFAVWAAVIYFVAGHAGKIYLWEWHRLETAFVLGADGGFFDGPLWLGLVCTLRISFLAMLLALALAALTTAMHLAGGPAARGLATVYVQTVRNSPLLIQIVFIYFVLTPALGLDWSGETCVVLALGFFEGAYMSEILRAGVLAVPRGQWEAALSLGLPGWYAAGSVVLPQALRISLPPLLSQSVSLVKDSSLASAIAVAELTQRAGIAVSASFKSLEIWFAVALVYLTVSLLLSLGAFVLRLWLSRGVASYNHS